MTNTGTWRVYEDSLGVWWWVLLDGDGKSIAQSVRGYESRGAVHAAIAVVSHTVIEMHAIGNSCRGMCDTDGGPHVHVDLDYADLAH